ncbi:hypothetical protein KRR40_17745 [Niabella defluvii]|nr:hypothetical protein KRR40_17745 [Niabella sp. I65]
MGSFIILFTQSKTYPTLQPSARHYSAQQITILPVKNVIYLGECGQLLFTKL